MNHVLSPRRSPLKGRYLVRNRALNAALRVTDAVLARVAEAHRATAPGTPARILLAVGGHLGDAVIATGALPLLARAYPGVSLGMLLPSWSRPVVDGHPALRWIHHADHWRMSRASAGTVAKWNRYRATASRAVQEIAAVGYDVAIDLYAYYPNSAALLRRAGIPVRIGYASGGCGPLYSTTLEWAADLGHTAAQHANLIAVLTRQPDVEWQYDLPSIPASGHARALALCGANDDETNAGYVVVHPGTGHPKKAWPRDAWSALIDRLVAAGERVVVTGAGAADRRLTDSLASDRHGVLNLVDQLDWTTFRAVLGNAKVVIGLDSVAVHVAAAAQTPVVAIMAAISDPEYWRPLGQRVAVLTRHVPCAPCFQKNGCDAMTCVRDITVDEVLAACETVIDHRRGADAVKFPVG